MDRSVTLFERPYFTHDIVMCTTTFSQIFLEKKLGTTEEHKHAKSKRMLLFVLNPVSCLQQRKGASQQAFFWRCILIWQNMFDMYVFL